MINLNYDSFRISEELLGVVSLGLVVKYRVVPFSLGEGVITLLVDEGFDGEVQEVLEFILGRRVLTELVDGDFICGVIDRYSAGLEKKRVEWGEGLGDGERLDLVGGGVFCEREVGGVVNKAIEMGASDIHWESQLDEQCLVIRFRIDGELVTVSSTLGFQLPPKVISYIKLLAHLNIDQKRLPQDGRLGWVYGEKRYDLRVSSLSTVYGESLVMRILDREDLNLDLEVLGLPTEDLDELKGLLEKPDGLFLVTGPTGSGKTTTLYAALNFRGRFDSKIITVEDPIEYEFSNFSQISVSAGMGFAGALRAVLRQSPDTIMIGEIRDRETAQIAFNAALTGHLVLTTLHTNDALSAVARLLDLGIEPYQISAALRAVVAQRLVRRLCEFCKESYSPHPEAMQLLNSLFSEPVDLPAESVFFRSVGCEACQYTGFKGRLGLFEILSLENELPKLIYEKASPEVLKNYAKSLGRLTLQECGLQKVLLGLTTLEEVAAASMG